jgi:hypothetical protein
MQLLDVEDDEPRVPALAPLHGGRPWLEEERSLRAEDSAEALPDVVAAPAGDAVAEAPVVDGRPPAADLAAPATAFASLPPGTPEYRGALRDTQLALTTAQNRIAQLERRLTEAGADDSQLARLEAEARMQRQIAQQVKVELADALHGAAELREQLSGMRRELRTRARVPDAAPAPSRDARRERWASDESWVRHEIYLAWVERVAAGEREHWPLPAGYVVSERFAPSLDALDEALFDKAMKAVVDVLTGRARDIPGREVHPLRQGEAGNAPDYVRHDGARCFRVYVEQKVPAARRLHFWQRTDGVVELERVVSHDVVVP